MKSMSRVSYTNVVESIIYAMKCTRSNISHEISVVSRYMNMPGKGHWQAVQLIMILKKIYLYWSVF